MTITNRPENQAHTIATLREAWKRTHSARRPDIREILPSVNPANHKNIPAENQTPD